MAAGGSGAPAPHGGRAAGCGRSAATPLLTAGAIVVLFPIYVTIVNSLLVPDQLVQQPPPLFPTDPQWHDYVAAWTSGSDVQVHGDLGDHDGIIVVGQLVTSILAAYAFAFLRFPFKRTLFVVCLATLMIPLEVTFITNLDTITSLHWFNTYAGLSIPFLATGLRHLPAAPGLPADPARPAGGRAARRVRAPALHDAGGRAAGPPVAGRARPCSRSSARGTSTCGRWSSTGGHDAALHRPDRPEATPRHPGLADPRLARRRRHRVRAAGDPAARSSRSSSCAASPAGAVK